jgi:glucose-6-phosphate isomerase
MTVRGPLEFLSEWRAALASWDDRRGTPRIWEGDASLWTGGGEASWLGWTRLAEAPEDDLRRLESRLAEAVPAGVDRVLLLGMGGSSLAAEVIAATVSAGQRTRAIEILDSTEPTTVSGALATTDWNRTMIVVASKSGTTLEPSILFCVAFEASSDALGREAAAQRVVAITDPHSALSAEAERLGAAAVIHGLPTVGGRYSALSPFGLVPASLMGVDLVAFLAPARAKAAACRKPSQSNPGVQLGVFLGLAARSGRDKCTLILGDDLAALGPWIEQLVAESTGQNGVVVLPIVGETLGDPATYGEDRAFVHVRSSTDAGARDAAVSALADAGHPVFIIESATARNVTAEFFRWEFATAVAGSVLGVNPFDQPDVEAAKVAARALTDAFERDGTLPADDESGPDLRRVLESVSPPSYVALLSFLPSTPNVKGVLQRIRAKVRDSRHVATSVGVGPRYLHSTGQAFKGGPATGVFVLLTCDAPVDVAVPGRRLTFGAVAAAQAAGDRRVLRERGRPVVHLHLRGPLDDALAGLETEVARALA